LEHEKYKKYLEHLKDWKEKYGKILTGITEHNFYIFFPDNIIKQFMKEGLIIKWCNSTEIML